MVNRVTPALFQKFPDPRSMGAADLGILEALIFKTGFYKSKAAHLKETGAILSTRFNSEVPESFEALLMLPGVGRKTAHVICGTLFGKPAIIVDTHFKRVVGRLGLTLKTDPESIEKDLALWVEPSQQYRLSMGANQHGRALCHARKPNCSQCPLGDLCPSAEQP